MKKTWGFMVACFILTGCETIGNWADDVGSYMPVLSDDRCEHWQCFTSEGQAQSEYNKTLRQQPQQEAPAQLEWDDAMEQQYTRYYQEQIAAGQMPLTRERYLDYMREFQAEAQAKTQQLQPKAAPSGYNPPPDANPWENYQP